MHVNMPMKRLGIMAIILAQKATKFIAHEISAKGGGSCGVGECASRQAPAHPCSDFRSLIAMEIGIDASRSLRAILTGTERYSLEITRHLLALPAASAHAWRLYTDDDVDLDALLVSRKQAVHNAEICVLDARPVWTHRALGPEVIRRPPDVLFVPAHVLPFSPRRRLLPPSVITIHDLGFRHFPEAHTPRQRWYLEAGTRWSAHAATAIICVSEATARDLQDAYGTPAEKIHVIHEAAAPRATVAKQRDGG